MVISQKARVNAVIFSCIWFVSGLLLKVPFLLVVGLLALIVLLVLANFYPKLVKAFIGVMMVWACATSLTSLPNYPAARAMTFDTTEIQSKAAFMKTKAMDTIKRDDEMTLDAKIAELDEALEGGSVTQSEYDALRAKILESFVQAP